jgi:hypothetical protein
MSCQRCQSDRLVRVSAKTSDQFYAETQNKEYDGYVPKGIGLGSNSDVCNFSYCLDCGQIQGSFPLPFPTELETDDCPDCEQQGLGEMDKY